MKYLIIFLIKIYQKFISPLKGYSCAYRAIHGSSSCSLWALHSIDKHNLSILSLKLISRRLEKCRHTYLVSIAGNDTHDNEEEPDNKNNKTEDNCLWCTPDACFIPFFSKL